jgi:23S rRNA (uracil1939-C5)-methyltransferase
MSHNETVRIEKLVHGGYGLGRLASGFVALVDGGVLPNELVEAEPVRLKRDMGFFRAIRILEPEAERVTPVCVHFQDCGGCQLQHMPYEYQLQAKKAMFLDSLSRQKGFEQDAIRLVSNVLPAHDSLEYRHFMRFHCAHTGESRPFLGLARRWSNEVTPTPRCRIADPLILECMNAIQSSGAWPELACSLQEISLGISLTERLVVAVLFLKNGVAGVADALIREIFERCEGIKACLVQDSSTRRLKTSFLRHGCDVIRRFPLPDSGVSTVSACLLASPGVFVQNNWSINLAIQDLIRQKGEACDCRSILDLHCGMGNFLLSCGRADMRLCGSDVSCEAVSDAGKNAAALGLSAELTCQTAKKQAEILSKHRQRFDLLILDPARGGCPELIPLLPYLSLRIVYISCDPPALARDLVLLGKKGYKIQEIRLFDMFAQTHHLESVTTLYMDERP